MIVKACGRSALGVIGLWMALAVPSFAAPTGDTTDTAASASATGAPIALNRYVKHGARHATRNGHHKSSKIAVKSTKRDSSQASEERKSTGMPDAVANAKAEMASASPTAADQNSFSEASAANPVAQNAPETQAPAAPTPWPSAPSASSENPPDRPSAAQAQVVTSDELNDIDRALETTSPSKPPLTLAMVSAEPAASPFSVAALLGNDSSTSLDKTSLIGKIFIGFGALLTMASAARMFMA
jgi:hypothetical protein